MKVIHKAKVTLSREVEVPDELWRRYNAGIDVSDEELEKATDELNDFMTEHGIRYDTEDVQDVHDEWYIEVKE